MELTKKQLDFFNNLQTTMESKAVQPEELTKVVKVLLEVFKNIKQQLEQSIQTTDIKLRMDLNNALDEIKILEKKMVNSLGEVSSKSQQFSLAEVSKIASELKQEMIRMKGEMPDMPDLSVLENRLFQIEKRPSVSAEDLLKEIPKFGEKVRDSLEVINEEKEKLRIEAIGFLRKELDDLKKQIREKMTSSGGGGGARITSLANFIIPISGTVDDSNVTFTSSKEPSFLIINGGSYKKTGGSITWTWVAGTITLSFAVGTGGAIWGIK